MHRIHIPVLAAGLTFFASASAFAQITLPDGPGRDLVYARCQTCHDLQYVKESKGLDKGAWADLMVTMYGFGLRIPDSDKAAIVNYLATYMGPNPPPAPAAAEAAPKKVDGAQVFSENCSACHQPNGQGVKDSFPPLAANTDLFSEELFPAHVLLHGMNGPIVVKGMKFDGEMPSFAHLDDDQIAAVINFVRSNLGNKALDAAGIKPVEAADVAKLRDEKMTPEQVHALRESDLKKK